MNTSEILNVNVVETLITSIIGGTILIGVIVKVKPLRNGIIYILREAIRVHDKEMYDKLAEIQKQLGNLKTEFKDHVNDKTWLHRIERLEYKLQYVLKELGISIFDDDHKKGNDDNDFK